MRTSKIYAWVCPETKAIVYVGKTSTTISRRMHSHFGRARRHCKTAKEVWLRDILERGLSPEIVILEETEVSLSSEAERKWASHYSQISPLLNSTKVGAGNPGVGRITWTPDLIALLGKVGDRKIAELIGCERKSVSYKRECLGIAAAMDRDDNLPPPHMGGWNRIELPESVIARLGKEPDYVIAESVGVVKTVIARVRRGLGIQDYASSTGNDGRMRSDRPHPRWIKRQEKKDAFLREGQIGDPVPDGVWAVVESMLPPAPTLGRHPLPTRKALRGVLYVLRSGIKWNDLRLAQIWGLGRLPTGGSVAG